MRHGGFEISAFKTALHLAAKTGSSHVSAFLPGTCDVALGIAVEHGMRISDGTGIGARFWNLDTLSAPQSGFHVTADGRSSHEGEVPLAPLALRPLFGNYPFAGGKADRVAARGGAAGESDRAAREPEFPVTDLQVADAQEAVRGKGLELEILRAGTDEEIDAAFEIVRQHRLPAIAVGANPYFDTPTQ